MRVRVGFVGVRCLFQLPFPSLPLANRIQRVPLADWRTAIDRMEAGGAAKQVLEVGAW